MWKRKNILVAVLAVAVPLSVTPIIAAQQIIRSDVCNDFAAPVITTQSSVSGTDDVSSHVTGTGEPNMTVYLINNGSGAAVATTASDGSFDVGVPLDPGVNHITAREIDACQTKESAEIQLERSVPPQVGGGAGTTKQPNVTALPSNDSSGTDNLSNPPISANTITDNVQFQILFPHDGQTVRGLKVLVRGTTVPNSVVDIYVNGRSVARIVADDKGNFATVVPIQAGKNVLHIVVTTPTGAVTERTLTIHSVIGTGTTNSTNIPAWVKPLVIGLTVLAVLAEIYIAALAIHDRSARTKHRFKR